MTVVIIIISSKSYKVVKIFQSGLFIEGSPPLEISSDAEDTDILDYSYKFKHFLCLTWNIPVIQS